MTARHWMQIAALGYALALTGTAMARDADGPASTGDRSSVSTEAAEPPSAGAIVTPEDKALRMGKDDARAGDRHGDGDGDAATSSDDALSVDPGPSSDDTSSVDPGPSGDEASSVDPDRADSREISPRYGMPASSGSMTNRGDAPRIDEDRSAPPRTDSDVRPGDMGPGDVRGE